MRAILLLTVVPIAAGLGACTDDVRVPDDELAPQQIRVDDPDTGQDGFALAAPNFVRIRNLSWAGTGCPAGTVAKNLAPDFKAFTLLFDRYVAEVGPKVPLSLGRKNCQILIDLEFPQGWSFTVFDVDYRGFVNVERGVSGVQESAYNFQGEKPTARLQTTLRGPRNGNYQIRDSLGLNALVWSPCGAQRALIINSEARVVSANPRARGVMTIDSINGKVTHIYGLQWRRCPA